MPLGQVRFLTSGVLLLVVAGLLPMLLPCFAASDGGETVIAQVPVDRLERGALAAPAVLPALSPGPLAALPKATSAAPLDEPLAGRLGRLSRGAAGSDPCRRR